jgi:DNA ligase-1
VGKYCKELPLFKKTVLYALDAYRLFNVTQVDFIEDGGACADTPYDIFKYLDTLAEQKGASNLDKKVLSSFSSIDKETVEVVRRIINKDLRCGVGVKIAEKFVPGVQEYGVMKPQTGKKTLLKDFEKFLELAGDYYNICWSIKVDGVRQCDVLVHADGTVQYFSTNGKLYQNFHCFNEKVIRLAQRIYDSTKGRVTYPMGFDGEVIAYDGNFQSVVTQTQREKDVDTSNLRLLLWSVPTSGLDFESSHLLIASRLPAVKVPLLEQSMIGPSARTNVFCLYHEFDHDINSWKEVETLARKYINLGEEGIILKVSNHMHERKRSRLWFRLKALYLEGQGIEADLKVLRWEKGTGKFSEKMGALICEYNGEEVRVGGGYTDAQREEFMTRTPKWITVNADSETNDGSLRFPQFSREREEK